MGGNVMGWITESLGKYEDQGETKSYFIGLERGREWAEDRADYFEMRQWAELEADEFDEIVLPGSEDLQLRLIMNDTKIEWTSYLKGWLAGVKESLSKY
jgi:CobQ-like glutamine amidotransferase family enzyme